jgi:acyl dehydratase
MTATITVGEVVAEQTYRVTRDNLVKYAGASGDFNPIHYRDDIAQSVGLPGVLAHGMLTMGIAIQPVTDWIGDPGKIVDYQVRFTRPVPVDAVDGATIVVTATVGAVDTGTARIDLTVVAGGATVLGKARVTVRFN